MDAELKEAVRPEVEKQLRERSYPLLMGPQDHDRCASYHGFGRSWLTYWTITPECSAAYEQITVMNTEAVQFSILNFQCFPLHFRWGTLRFRYGIRIISSEPSK